METQLPKAAATRLLFDLSPAQRTPVVRAMIIWLLPWNSYWRFLPPLFGLFSSQVLSLKHCYLIVNFFLSCTFLLFIAVIAFLLLFYNALCSLESKIEILFTVRLYSLWTCSGHYNIKQNRILWSTKSQRETIRVLDKQSLADTYIVWIIHTNKVKKLFLYNRITS